VISTNIEKIVYCNEKHKSAKVKSFGIKSNTLRFWAD